MANVPPVPLGDIQTFPHTIQEWFRQVQNALSGGAGGKIKWSNIDTSGSNLTDIVTRNHNNLQNIGGGAANDYNHLTTAEYGLVHNTQTANTVLAGPSSGVPALPTYRAITASDIPGSALTKTDDTNVTLTLGGSPTTALLNAASITVGWTGTLAAARLNSNVVQGITNDTNVTGSIAAQNLTLGWTGTLGTSRGGTGTAGGSMYSHAFCGGI